MGPPPKDPAQRRRRNAAPGMRELPAAGRTGRTPAWPLPKRVDDVPPPPIELVGEDLEDDAKVKRYTQARGEWERLLEAAQRADRREATLWRSLWRTPQAVAWEELGWAHEVAMYVRLVVLGERGDVKALGEARQWSDRLGLTPLALLRLRWTIASAKPAERSGSSTVTVLDHYRDALGS